jgi:hypothetical protein
MTPRADEGSRFRVQPDPPVAGQPADVTYLGPARDVEWQADDGTPVRVRPDANGRFQIDPVPSGRSLMLSDNLGLPGYWQGRIQDTFR